MTSRLYLHIGPPKTGTTSFQIAFEQANFDWLAYGGVFQPRERNTNSLAQRLHQYAAGRLSPNDPTVTATVTEIHDYLDANRSVLISEEMFLVEQHGCSFVRKLEQIGNLLVETPTTVLLTLRDPSDGLPSLYQEMFPGLPLPEKFSFARFCHGPRARCYDYRFVGEVLRRSGFSDVRMFGFSELTAAATGLDVPRAFAPAAPAEARVCISQANVGIKSHDGRAVPAITLKAIGSTRLVRTLLDRTGLRQKAAFRALAGGLDRITLRRPGAQQLRIPDELTERYGKSYEQARAYLEYEKETS